MQAEFRVGGVHVQRTAAGQIDISGATTSLSPTEALLLARLLSAIAAPDTAPWHTAQLAPVTAEAIAQTAEATPVAAAAPEPPAPAQEAPAVAPEQPQGRAVRNAALATVADAAPTGPQTRRVRGDAAPSAPSAEVRVRKPQTDSEAAAALAQFGVAGQSKRALFPRSPQAAGWLIRGATLAPPRIKRPTEAAPSAAVAPVQPPAPYPAAVAVRAVVAAADAPAKIRKKPGPKSNAEKAAIAAALAAAGGSPAAAPAASATPAQTRASTAASPARATPVLHAKIGTPQPKAQRLRLMDKYDQWMRVHPGQRTKEELVTIGVAEGWLPREDAVRVFNVAMHRARDLFHVLRDGTTETYLRRAEVATPTSTAPGKLVRRRVGEPDAVRRP